MVEQPQTTRFWQAALQSGLIDADALRGCWDSLPPEKQTLDAADRRLARQAVNRGVLTLWQAQQLLGGRSSGYKIDKYVLQDLIGQGGMGRVYLAMDVRLKRRVALKVLSRERMNNPRAVARFQREAKVGAQLQHENLVRIYDEGDTGTVRYLVMEYIHGKNLAHIMAGRGPIDPVASAGLIRQVALGLDHARHKGLIHRDVNPMNILVTDDGLAKLTDLGLAIDLYDAEDIVTRDGATVGTFDYISPEQARHSRSVDTRSDIYSLGCTFYHIVTGRVPFPQPSLPEKLYAHQMLEPDPPSSLVPGLPEGMEAIIRRMVRKSPDERYPDPEALVAALEPYSPQAPIPLSQIEAAPVIPRLDPSGPSPPGSSATATTRVASSDSLIEPAGAVKLDDDPTAISDSYSTLPQIDLGPEPPLSESTSRILRDSSSPPFKLSPSRLIALIAGTVAALVLVVAIAVVVARAGLSKGGSSPGAPKTPVIVVPDPVPERAEITVHFEDGAEMVESDLGEAIRRASGKRGAEVILRNKKPLKFEVKAPIEVAGDLVIRGEDGMRPMLVVALAGAEPLLRSLAEVRLKITGIAFDVVLTGPRGEGESPTLLDVSGDLTLDRCSFQLTGTERNVAAVVTEGHKNKLDGCVFRGFDRPIVFRSLPNSEARLSQCLFVRDQLRNEPSGWAVTVSGRPSGDATGPRLLVLDRVTALCGGLIAVENLAKAEPLTVEVAQSVLRAPTLLMAPKDAFPSSIAKWSGRSNRYAVSGASWVVQPPNGLDDFPGGPTDLKSWSLATNSSEPDTTDDPAKFSSELRGGLEDRPIADFQLSGDEKTGGIGIDPEKLGPPRK